MKLILCFLYFTFALLGQVEYVTPQNSLANLYLLQPQSYWIATGEIDTVKAEIIVTQREGFEKKLIVIEGYLIKERYQYAWKYDSFPSTEDIWQTEKYISLSGREIPAETVWMTKEIDF